MLRLNLVSWRLDGRVVLDAVTLEMKAGEVVFVEGPRGAGKTALLEIAGARRRPDSGQLWIAHRDVTMLQRRSLPFVRRNIGFSAAVPRFLPGLNVLENVMLPFAARSEPVDWARDAALRALGKLGVVGLAMRDPATLSASERRLVEMTRALAGAPSLMLFDDPGASLSPGDSSALLSVLFGAAGKGAAVMCGSADATLVGAAVRAGARRLRMDAGRIVSDREPLAIVGKRSDLRVASSAVTT